LRSSQRSSRTTRQSRGGLSASFLGRVREARFGYDHSDTLKSRGNLARAYVEQPDVMAGIEKGTRDHQQPERDPVAFPEVLCDGLVGGV